MLHGNLDFILTLLVVVEKAIRKFYELLLGASKTHLRLRRLFLVREAVTRLIRVLDQLLGLLLLLSRAAPRQIILTVSLVFQVSIELHRFLVADFIVLSRLIDIHFLVLSGDFNGHFDLLILFSHICNFLDVISLASCLTVRLCIYNGSYFLVSGRILITHSW